MWYFFRKTQTFWSVLVFLMLFLRPSFIFSPAAPPPSPREVAQAAGVAQARGADAAQKARVVEEFLARKREAALNRHKGNGIAYSPIGGFDPRAKENNPQEVHRQFFVVYFRNFRNVGVWGWLIHS